MKHPLFLMPPSTPTHHHPSPNTSPHSPPYHFSFTFGSSWCKLHPNCRPSLQKTTVTTHIPQLRTRVTSFPSQISHHQVNKLFGAPLPMNQCHLPYPPNNITIKLMTFPNTSLRHTSQQPLLPCPISILSSNWALPLRHRQWGDILVPQPSIRARQHLRYSKW